VRFGALGSGRLVDAEGLLGEIVAVFVKGPGPTAPAHPFELATAALAGEQIRIPQDGENFRAFPDFLALY